MASPDTTGAKESVILRLLSPAWLQHSTRNTVRHICSTAVRIVRYLKLSSPKGSAARNRRRKYKKVDQAFLSTDIQASVCLGSKGRPDEVQEHLRGSHRETKASPTEAKSMKPTLQYIYLQTPTTLANDLDAKQSDVDFSSWLDSSARSYPSSLQ